MAKKMELQVWVEGTVIAAAAMALSFIPIQTANSAFDLSLGMVPLVLYSYRRGFVPGLTAGFVWGLLSIVVGTAMKNFVVQCPKLFLSILLLLLLVVLGDYLPKKSNTPFIHIVI